MYQNDIYNAEYYKYIIFLKDAAKMPNLPNQTMPNVMGTSVLTANFENAIDQRN